MTLLRPVGSVQFFARCFSAISVCLFSTVCIAQIGPPVDPGSACVEEEFKNFRNGFQVDELDPSLFIDGDVLKTTLSIKITNKLGHAMYFQVTHQLRKIVDPEIVIENHTLTRYLEPNEVWEPYTEASPSTIQTEVAPKNRHNTMLLNISPLRLMTLFPELPKIR